MTNNLPDGWEWSRVMIESNVPGVMWSCGPQWRLYDSAGRRMATVQLADRDEDFEWHGVARDEWIYRGSFRTLEQATEAVEKWAREEAGKVKS